MLSGSLIHPLIVPQWIVKAVKDATYGVDAYFASQALSQRISGRVYDRDEAPRAEENSSATLWPFVAYKKVGNDQLQNYGELPLLGDADYLITFVMWYAALPNNISLKAYTAQGQMALQNCFAGVRVSAGSAGLVHGCELSQSVGPISQGTERFQVMEAGYMVRLRTGPNV